MTHRPIEFPVEGISDGEVRLRLLVEGDLPAMIEALQDPQIPRWTRVPSPYGEAEARSWWVEQARRRTDAEGIDTVIVDEHDGGLLGGVGIPHLDWEEGTCELGYWLARRGRGRGVMTRAVRLLSAWIFENLPIARIGILAAVANEASKSVAERAGFAYEGVLRSYIVIKGTRHDVASYSLLREDLGDPSFRARTQIHDH